MSSGEIRPLPIMYCGTLGLAGLSGVGITRTTFSGLATGASTGRGVTGGGVLIAAISGDGSGIGPAMAETSGLGDVSITLGPATQEKKINTETRHKQAK